MKAEVEVKRNEYFIKAEKLKFIETILTGVGLVQKTYATYLWNLHKKYDLVETVAESAGLLGNLSGIQRKARVLEDYNELWNESDSPPILNSTNEYIKHFKNIMDHEEAILGHLYALYIGTLEHGAILADKTPGRGVMYQYNDGLMDGELAILKLKDTLLDKISNEGSGTTVSEAENCFNLSLKLCEEIVGLDI